MHCSCLIASAPFFTAPDKVEAAVREAVALAVEAGAYFLMMIPGDRGLKDQAA